MIALSAATARFAGPLGRCTSRLSVWAGAIAAVLRRRRTYCSLASLDDRMLHDIGLDRSMILGVSFHGIRSARDAMPMTGSDPLPDGNPSTLTWALKLVSEMRERRAAEELRRFESVLGPNQLKELSSKAFGPPVGGSTH